MRIQLRGMLIVVCVALLGLVARAEDTLRVVDTQLDPGTIGGQVTINGTNDVPIQGLSLALSYPNEVLTCTGLDFTGTAIESALGGGAPEYVGVLNNPTATATDGTIVAGIIFDLDPTAAAELPVTATEAPFVHLVFDVDPLDVPSTHTIEFVDGLGTPPVENHFSSDGFTVLPSQLIPGTVSITNNYHMYLGNPVLPAGASTNLILRGDFPVDIDGFEATIQFRPSEITLNPPATFQGYIMGMESSTSLVPTGTTAEFVNVTFLTDPIVVGQADLRVLSVAVVFDYLGPPFAGQVLAAGSNRSLVRFPITVSGSLAVDDCVNVELVNFVTTTGETYDNFLIVDDGASSVFAELSGGEICIGSNPGFKRGDANGDGITNVADPIFLLTYIFSGGPTPGCSDAADMNDDSVVNVADAIYGISYIFAGGPPPPAPGPTTCGDDPTPDALGCNMYFGCP